MLRFVLKSMLRVYLYGENVWNNACVLKRSWRRYPHKLFFFIKSGTLRYSLCKYIQKRRLCEKKKEGASERKLFESFQASLFVWIRVDGRRLRTHIAKCYILVKFGSTNCSPLFVSFSYFSRSVFVIGLSDAVQLEYRR